MARTNRLPRAGVALAILASWGGIVGLLATLYILTRIPGNGSLALGLFATVVLVSSVAELVFAYGVGTGSTWAVQPASRAVGSAVALALLGVGFWIALSAPVSMSDATIGQPVVMPSAQTQSP
jgi:hypothetical protein